MSEEKAGLIPHTPKQRRPKEHKTYYSDMTVRELDPLKERQRVAGQLRRSRATERLNTFTTDRGKDGYLEKFDGLKYLFEYVKGLEKPVVLDVGAGITRGIFELSQDEIGQGLEFLATVLRRSPRMKDYLGEDRTISTSAETLARISDSSVGGILALNSVAYTTSPERVVKSIDRVLVPGGAIKMTFGDRWYGAIMKSFTDFAPLFNELGYDYFNLRDDEHGVDMVLAIKPGGRDKVQARDLLGRDYTFFHKTEPWKPWMPPEK